MFSVCCCCLITAFVGDNKLILIVLAITAIITTISYATSSPVSTEIGDDLWWVYHPGIYPGH